VERLTDNQEAGSSNLLSPTRDFMIDPSRRASILRPLMMKDGKFLITRIAGSNQEADPKKVLDKFFRYKDYISSDGTEYEKEWLKTKPSEVWSKKFIGLSDNFMSKPLEEVKKLEFQNPAYSAALKMKGDPRDYNKVFAVQVSGCTYNCNFCYVPPEVNAANPKLGRFFSAKKIIKFFIKAREKSKEQMNVLRITGGEAPSIIPEIIVDLYAELEKMEGVYLWIDTNLSTKKYLEVSESDLKCIVRKKNVGVVGCFKGVNEEDFAMITGADSKSYENQFETARLLLKWKADFYSYLPALVYGSNIEEKMSGFMNKLKELNKNLPLRLEMLIIKNYPGALMNIEEKAKQGRPLPGNGQRLIFDLWYNKLLPKHYSKTIMGKFCCEVPLY
jgi:uncharacterized Fe-S cluster-containing radical SAM superfamily protein